MAGPYRTPGTDEELDARLDAELKALDAAESMEMVDRREWNVVRIRRGVIVLAVGVGITIASCSASGEGYLLAYGPILYGLGMIFRGLAGR